MILSEADIDGRCTARLGPKTESIHLIRTQRIRSSHEVDDLRLLRVRGGNAHNDGTIGRCHFEVRDGTVWLVGHNETPRLASQGNSARPCRWDKRREQEDPCDGNSARSAPDEPRISLDGIVHGYLNKMYSLRSVSSGLYCLLQ